MDKKDLRAKVAANVKALSPAYCEAAYAAIGGHIRRISTARTLIDNGRPASELANICKIGDFPARKTMESARRFSPDFCKKASELILETDYRMKTSFDEQERLLEMLVLQLAREA